MYLQYPLSEGNATAPANGSLVFSQLAGVSPVHRHYAVSLFLSCLYTVFLFPVGFVGNVLILTVNLAHRGPMTAPDLYFVNLAAADLVLVGDSLIEVFNLKEGYYDNAALCVFMSLLQQVNMYSSVFFLTWMSFDRFVALTAAGAVGRGVPRARLVCCLIWASATLLTAVPLAVAQARHAGELHFCFADVSQVQWLEVTLGFLAPFCVLAVCYWRIARVLALAGRPRRRQKALRMISAAVLVFFVCWLPENVFLGVHLLWGEAGDSGGAGLRHDYPLTAHVVSLAAFSNSCLNPLVYSFLGETFQDKLRLFFAPAAAGHRSTSRILARLPVVASACGCAPCKEACKSTQLLLSTCCLQPSAVYASHPHLPQLFCDACDSNV